jgi:hypothetical protein
MAVRRGYFSALVALFCAITSAPAAEPPSGLLALAPDITLNQDDRTQLAAGNTIIRLQAASDGYLSLSAMVRADISPERFLRWMTSVEILQKGKYIPEIGRFSTPPAEHDLRGLTIDVEDLRDLERCEPSDCGLKLSEPEIAAIARQRDEEALRQTLRRILIGRATHYLVRGDSGAAPYLDHDDPVDPGEAFDGVLQRAAFFPRSLRCYADYLRAFPKGDDSRVRHSFLYWSRESLGLKPIISVTHLSAARFEEPHLPEAVVVARQVYASHYKNASITITALVADGPTRYLVYVNRTHVDAFGGMFGHMVRRLVERRVRSEAPAVLQNLRQRLEAGEPPA